MLRNNAIFVLNKRTRPVTTDYFLSLSTTLKKSIKTFKILILVSMNENIHYRVENGIRIEFDVGLIPIGPYYSPNEHTYLRGHIYRGCTKMTTKRQQIYKPDQFHFNE